MVQGGIKRRLVADGGRAAQGSRPMQRWYQPCMQAPKQRKEAEESLSVCGGEEGEAAIVWVPTIHEGAELVLAARRRKRSGLPAARGRRRRRRGLFRL